MQHLKLNPLLSGQWKESSYVTAVADNANLPSLGLDYNNGKVVEFSTEDLLTELLVQNLVGLIQLAIQQETGARKILL